MREAVFKDEDGRMWAVLVPDEAPDSAASQGIPLGPPDLSELNLPHDLEVRLHNELYRRHLWNREDLKRRQNELVAALNAAQSAVIQKLTELYWR